MKNKKHVHSELIHAWADGAKIQFKNTKGEWQDTATPLWENTWEYRIKPETSNVLKKTVPSSTNFQLDSKPLTGGEITLIKALREVKIAHVPNIGDAHMAFVKDGKLDGEYHFVGFTSHITYEENVIAALKQIQAEREVSNEV